MTSTSMPAPLGTSGLPRHPLRLRLSGNPGEATHDGGWWPQSRELDLELADLVDNLPTSSGVHQVFYARADWDTGPSSVLVARGRLDTSEFVSDVANVLVLGMSAGNDLRLLVVPHDHPVGEQAITIAADPANRWDTAQILAAGAFDEEDGPSDVPWTDDGDSWWPHPAEGPPSFR